MGLTIGLMYTFLGYTHVCGLNPHFIDYFSLHNDDDVDVDALFDFLSCLTDTGQASTN